jgi:hypothetical protein
VVVERAASVLVLGGVAVLGGMSALGVNLPLSHFAVHEAGAGALGLRVGALALAWLFCGRRPGWFAGVATLFVGSLVWQGLAAPLVGAAAAAIASSDERPSPWAPALIAAASLALWARGRQPVELAAEPPADPAAATAWWTARDNLWRAHDAALHWALKERDAPGAGYVALAEIDWKLTERDKALRVLAKVLAPDGDPAARARAETLRHEWSDER